MALSVQQKIDIANVSSIYTSNELGGGELHGGQIDESLPSFIYSVRQGLQWLYELDPTHEDLEPIGNYLLSICRYSAKAALNITGVATMPAVIIAAAPPRKDFIVSATSYMVTGASSRSIPEFIGYELVFIRGGVSQSTVNTEPTYFSWDKNSGIFICFPALLTDELIALIPV